MKYLLIVLIVFFAIPFACKSQAIQQLKAEKYQVSIHTHFVPGDSTALQQVINIMLTGKPLDAASNTASAALPIKK